MYFDSSNSELLDDIGRPVERNVLDDVHHLHDHHDLGYSHGTSGDVVGEETGGSDDKLGELEGLYALVHLQQLGVSEEPNVGDLQLHVGLHEGVVTHLLDVLGRVDSHVTPSEPDDCPHRHYVDGVHLQSLVCLAVHVVERVVLRVNFPVDLHLKLLSH